MRPRQDKHRRWVTIRRQKPGMAREGQPLKWCAACQHCGRGCASPDWSDVIAWGSVHRGHCSAVPLPSYVTLEPSPSPGVPPLFADLYRDVIHPGRLRIKGKGRI